MCSLYNIQKTQIVSHAQIGKNENFQFTKFELVVFCLLASKTTIFLVSLEEKVGKFNAP